MASIAPTPGIAPDAMDRDDTPMPTRTQASKGSAPASPHTPTGLPARAPARATCAISDRGAGCHGSAYSARSAEVRSAAIVYW